MVVLFGILAIIVITLVIIGLPSLIMGLFGAFITLYEISTDKRVEGDTDRLSTSMLIILGSSSALGLAIFISFCVENI